MLEDPAGTDNFLDHLNPNRWRCSPAKVEPSLAGAAAGARFQFERLGYFWSTRHDASGALVFNRTVSLRDTWARILKKPNSPSARSTRSLFGI